MSIFDSLLGIEKLLFLNHCLPLKFYNIFDSNPKLELVCPSWFIFPTWKDTGLGSLRHLGTLHSMIYLVRVIYRSNWFIGRSLELYASIDSFVIIDLIIWRESFNSPEIFMSLIHLSQVINLLKWFSSPIWKDSFDKIYWFLLDFIFRYWVINPSIDFVAFCWFITHA